jgi:hypothetical protein
MKTIAFAIVALAFTGGAASAQYYNPYGGNVYVYAPPPMASPFPDAAIIQDNLSGAALQRNQMNELRLQMMREQLRQMQQR